MLYYFTRLSAEQEFVYYFWEPYLMRETIDKPDSFSIEKLFVLDLAMYDW